MSFDLAGIINFIFTALMLLVLARAIFSWFDPGLRTQVGQLIFRLTEPMLAPIRRILPATGMLDLSPIILIVALQILRNLLLNAIG